MNKETSQIEARLAEVRMRIDRACARAGRSPRDITLVAVTKTHTADVVAAAHAAGLRDFGENRVQEAAPKIADTKAGGLTATWHLIGHLQRNKAAAVSNLFDILQTIDSIRLAETVSAHASRPVRAFIEVNVAREPSKFGVAPEEGPSLAEALGRLPNIELIGLMTVAPAVDDPELVRPVFRALRQLRDAIGLRELSMGMTADYEIAIEEGSTVIRVGRALFGLRDPGGQRPALGGA